MTDLMELASRVAEAKGPDRALDAEIAVTLDVTVDGNRYTASYLHSVGNSFADIGQYTDCPAYTASTDAAMSLLPGDEPWDIGREGRDTYFADLTCFYPGDVQDEPDASKVPYATAWSPALALTAACLRARAHQGTAHVEQ